ncbi:bromodomain-containing protein 7-like [Pollicipes pollicipes]|uniref:bromodomain-containing protein 7-like n=1 Tax=Pollicipes pollicipes TaxID=41117 RepID=UPI001884B5C0|nr:bromodomain-containing protein 7-like [Pollicipes pollicipes]
MPVSRPAGLRLVLKVGVALTPDHEPRSVTPPPAVAPLRFSMAAINEAETQRKEKKHKKKKKKDKDRDRERHRHKKERRHLEAVWACGLEETSRLSSGTEPLSQGTASSPEPPSVPPLAEAAPGWPQAAEREQRPAKSSLQRFLEYLLKGLEKKDTQRFFTAPVTDALAPGYSNVIRHPMDFSTMRTKIEADRYPSLAAFQMPADFRLMCSNAMAYNRADTIYFKAAKRLLHIGSKMMSPDKLASCAEAAEPVAERLSGFIFKRPYVRLEKLAGGAALGACKSVPEPVDEEAEAEEILQQAQAAARRAAERLAARTTVPKLGFLRQRPDGSTSLSILTPAEGESGEEKPVSLGVLTGRLSQGTAHPAGFREDKRNITKPVKPVHHGPYGSYGPCYDSAFANISVEESELLAQTYGDETCQQYAQSVRQFADGCYMATEMVDNLLDILTDGRHRPAQQVLEQHRQLAMEERLVSAALAAAVAAPAAPTGQQVDFAALKSLSSLGIDVSFLDAIESEERRGQEAPGRLDQTSELIASLSEIQRRRLSQPPDTAPAAPSQQETELADAVVGRLTAMARQTAPGELAPTAAVRKALGLGPVTGSPDNPSSHEEVDVEAVSTAATPEVRRLDSPPGQPGLHDLLADV